MTVAASLATVWTATAVLIMGVRPDWGELPLVSLAATLGGLVAVAVLALSAGLARGRLMLGSSSELFSAVLVASPLALLLLVSIVDPRGPSSVMWPGGQATAAHAWKCHVLVLGLSLPLLGFGLLLLRGLTLSRPALSGACLGLGVATWAHAIIRAHCSIAGPDHALLGHLLPALPLMGVTSLAMLILARRSTSLFTPPPQ